MKEPKEQKETKTKKSKAIIIVPAVLGTVIAVGGSLYGYTQYKAYQEKQLIYTQGFELLQNKQYDEAIETLTSISGYKDTDELIKQGVYALSDIEIEKAIELQELGKYEESIEVLRNIQGYKNADQLIADNTKIITDNYIEQIGVITYEVNRAKELTVGFGDVIVNDWTKAEEENKDIAETLKATFQTRQAEVDRLTEMEENLNKEIESVTDFNKTIYERLHDCYNKFEEIYKQVMKPTGDLENFSNNLRIESKNFDSLLDRLFTAEPKLKESVETAKKSDEHLSNQ